MAVSTVSARKKAKMAKVLDEGGATETAGFDSNKKPQQQANPVQNGFREGPREERVVVTVRVRPLSAREVAKNDTCAWECVDAHTIISKPNACPNVVLDKSPATQRKAYIYDRVFGPECSTEQVYEEGVKSIALSSLTGVNATIFAYGQTSSGKTYTMKGIIENTISDIYTYISKQSGERAYILKVAALEIYNEIVTDLLNPESGPLRLLDDPEKGTMIEKLENTVVRDINHLHNILSVCEAQRQVGETILNEASSRSHQIIRLMIESFLQVTTAEGMFNSLVAHLNFVDLAGSERASQTMTEGTRLKEGSHINRSLLTLSSVIRKLSGHKGHTQIAHLPYRDSKLTRILQSSLGGNAKTAIICTMSPALSQFEQSRNTLSFATRAKEVTNAAHVNMVISDKTMVKQLQREVSHLNSESQTPGFTSVCAAQAEIIMDAKDLKIKKMEVEMEELKLQRDHAQAQLQELLNKMREKKCSKKYVGHGSPLETFPVNAEVLDTPKAHGATCTGDLLAETVSPLSQKKTSLLMRALPLKRGSMSPANSTLLIEEIQKLEQLQNQIGEDANEALETLQKEAECLRLAQASMCKDTAATISRLQEEICSMHMPRKADQENFKHMALSIPPKGISIMEISRLQDESHQATIATLEEQLQKVQKSIESLINITSKTTEESLASNGGSTCRKRHCPLTPLSGHSNNNMAVQPSPGSRKALFPAQCHHNNENHPPKMSAILSRRKLRRVCDEGNPALRKCEHVNFEEETENNITTVLPNVTPSTRCTTCSSSSSVDIKKMQQMFKTAAEKNIQSIRAYVTELKERVAKLQYQKQLLICQVLDMETLHGGQDKGEEAQGVESTSLDCGTDGLEGSSPQGWQAAFDAQRVHIVELWHECRVSIVHRTQFYLLFRGVDPSDVLYLEVELRRLNWLKKHMVAGDSEGVATPSAAATARALKQEREMLTKRMQIRFTVEEREELYRRWGVEPESKHRKSQLVELLWSSPYCTPHIEESAAIVARLVGFWEPCDNGDDAENEDGPYRKEMFQLTFTPATTEGIPGNNTAPSPSFYSAWIPGWSTIVSALKSASKS